MLVSFCFCCCCCFVVFMKLQRSRTETWGTKPEMKKIKKIKIKKKRVKCISVKTNAGLQIRWQYWCFYFSHNICFGYSKESSQWDGYLNTKNLFKVCFGYLKEPSQWDGFLSTQNLFNICFGYSASQSLAQTECQSWSASKPSAL